MECKYRATIKPIPPPDTWTSNVVYVDRDAVVDRVACKYPIDTGWIKLDEPVHVKAGKWYKVTVQSFPEDKNEI